MRLPLVLLTLACLMSVAVAQGSEVNGQAQTAPSSARAVLEQMTPAERSNSCISAEFESSDSDAVMLGRQVERLWNGGQSDEALAQLDNLQTRVGHVAIGNSWRKPVPTLETNLWGRDVRIGNRDSLMDLAFDADPNTGNLFVALRHNATAPHFSVCMSNDNGTTWDETYTWSGSPPTAMDAGVTADHFYVAYNSPDDDSQQIRLRRFSCGNGLPDAFPGDGSWIVPCTLAKRTTMKGISFTPRRRSGELFLITLVSDGNVLCSRSSGALVSWGSFGVASGASTGLDATGETNCDTTSFYLCYYDACDTLRVCRDNWGGPKVLSLPTGSGTSTSISGNGDTIICMYEDQTSSPHQVRYVINYGDSDTWRLGTLSSPDTAAEVPAVVATSNGMVAAVYRHCAPTRELRFHLRTFTGPWSEPVSIADHEPYWNRPGIKYMYTSGAFGIVYLSNTAPVVRGAYFDRSDWAYGVTEQRRRASIRTSSATVIRGVLLLPWLGTQAENRDSSPERLRPTRRGTVPIFRAALLDISGRTVQRLHSGANDVSKLAPGVYFVRSEPSAVSGQPSAVTKVVVTR